MRSASNSIRCLKQLNVLAPDVAALRVNKWADEATAGRISDVVSPTDFDEDTRFMLTNAVYFKAVWKSSFLRQETRRGVFKSLGDDLQMHYMHQRLRSQYAESNVSLVRGQRVAQRFAVDRGRTQLIRGRLPATRDCTLHLHAKKGKNPLRPPSYANQPPAGSGVKKLIRPGHSSPRLAGAVWAG
jgi:hypothetical protein